MKNLASLQRRLNNIGSKQDRKKNPHDPLSNPVFFLKRGEKDPFISLQAYAKKVVSNNFDCSCLIMF